MTTSQRTSRRTGSNATPARKHAAMATHHSPAAAPPKSSHGTSATAKVGGYV